MLHVTLTHAQFYPFVPTPEPDAHDEEAKETTRKVEKVIKPLHPSQPEQTQIEIKEAEHLYREIRVENELTDEHGEKSALKPGAEVDVIVEADSNATTKKTGK